MLSTLPTDSIQFHRTLQIGARKHRRQVRLFWEGKCEIYSQKILDVWNCITNTSSGLLGYFRKIVLLMQTGAEDLPSFPSTIHYEKKPFPQYVDTFSKMCQVRVNKSTFFLTPKCSCGQVKCGSDNPGETALKVRKKIKSYFSSETFFPQKLPLETDLSWTLAKKDDLCQIREASRFRPKAMARFPDFLGKHLPRAEQGGLMFFSLQIRDRWKMPKVLLGTTLRLTNSKLSATKSFKSFIKC